MKFENNTTPTDEQVDFFWTITTSTGDVFFESTEKNPELVIEQVGYYTVSLYAVTENGCSDRMICPDCIKVYLQPEVEFTPIPQVASLQDGGEIVFYNESDSAYIGDTNVDYRWEFGDGEESLDFSPTHAYTTWGDYTVTFYVETKQGCVSQRSHNITVESELEFPNVITPNGDGYNDVFAIKGLNTEINSEDPYKYRTNELHIHDRYGKLVYKANNYDTYAKDDQIFLGSQVFDGGKLSDGVYYYTFYYRAHLKEKTFHGSLSIIRGE